MSLIHQFDNYYQLLALKKKNLKLECALNKKVGPTVGRKRKRPCITPQTFI